MVAIMDVPIDKQADTQLGKTCSIEYLFNIFRNVTI